MTSNINNEKDCGMLNQIQPDLKFLLCNCNTFNQYCIDLGDKKRLFTVIGETHLPQLTESCGGNSFPPYNYIDLIFKLSWRLAKKIKVFLELPIQGFHYHYSSINIEQILQIENNLKADLEDSYKKYKDPIILKMIDLVPKLEPVDPRYLDEKEDFIRNIYSYETLKDITLKDLERELSQESYFLKRINPLIRQLFFNIKESYLEKDFKRIRQFYISNISDKYKEIRDFFDKEIKPNINDNSIDLKNIAYIKEIEKIIMDLRYFYSKIVDFYVYVQIFNKDNGDDNHIIFLTGDSHAENIKTSFLSRHHIFEKNKDKNEIINIEGSYY